MNLAVKKYEPPEHSTYVCQIAVDVAGVQALGCLGILMNYSILRVAIFPAGKVKVSLEYRPFSILIELSGSFTE